MSYMELRDASGAFLGMCDAGGFPSDLRSINLPVAQPMRAVFEPADMLTLPTIEIVEVEFAEWCEHGRIRTLLRLRSGNPEWLTRVGRVHVRGATCKTKYGKAVELAETLVRLYHLVQFHKFKKTCLTRIH